MTNTTGAPIPLLPFRTCGHGSVRVLCAAAGDFYVDPFRNDVVAGDADDAGATGTRAPAGVVLVTHGHEDHGAVSSVGHALRRGGLLVAPSCEAARLTPVAAARDAQFVALDEGGATSGPGWTLRGLRHEGPARAAGFHPRRRGTAFLLEADGGRYLFLGDSDAHPEHAGLAPDVAFFAVGGFTVNDPEEAARAAARVAAGLAVPVGWGDVSARFSAARRFVELCAAAGVRAAAVSAETRREDP